jgi:two-component system, OmpR family, sensor histidine kinase MprB
MAEATPTERSTPSSSWLSRFSFRSRVAALTASAVAVAVIIAAVSSYLAVSHQLFSQVNRSLEADAATLQNSGRPVGNGTICYPDRVITQIENVDGDGIQFFDSQGTILQSCDAVSDGPAVGGQPLINPNKRALAVAASALNANRIGNWIFQDVTVQGVPYRVLTMALGVSAQTGNGVAVQIAHPLSETRSTLNELRLVLSIVALLSIALAVGLGLSVAGVTIRPVKRLTAAAEHVAATQDLDAQIYEEGDDELARLAHAFNAMLEALAASRRQQAQLISDAGHELRTPLTSLRTNIEVLMRVRELPAADREELLGDVQAQLDELTTLVGDVVDLARQDEVQVEPTEIRLDELVERAVERARRRNSTLTFDVDLDAGSVRAQPALLERAILNVLDNAAKFSPSGGSVEVRLRRADRWLLDIRDHGPGVAPEDLERVFDRFYRAPSARSLPGSGLGLAIVKQVITSHGGVVSVFLPPDGGTLLHIELPIVSEEEPDHAGPEEPGEEWRVPASVGRHGGAEANGAQFEANGFANGAWREVNGIYGPAAGPQDPGTDRGAQPPASAPVEGPNAQEATDSSETDDAASVVQDPPPPPPPARGASEQEMPDAGNGQAPGDGVPARTSSDR